MIKSIGMRLVRTLPPRRRPATVLRVLADRLRRGALPAVERLAEWGIARLLAAHRPGLPLPARLRFRLKSIRRPWGTTLVVRADVWR